MKIAFLGTPQFSVTILKALASSPYRPSWVITEPDKPVGRKQIVTPPPVKTIAQTLEIPTEQPKNRTELLTVLNKTQPDLLIVVAYGHILTEEMLAISKFGSLNIHASLLPKYRGASPIQASILAGDSETGVTIMKIDKGLDTGPVLGWAPIEIESNDTTPILAEKLAEIGAALLVEILPGYLNGSIVPQNQKNTPGTVTKIITKDAGQLTSSESPANVEKMIRAYTPWPGVWTQIGEERILILAAHLDHNLLKIDKLQLAGKKPVDWKTFQTGHPQLTTQLLTSLKYLTPRG